MRAIRLATIRRMGIIGISTCLSLSFVTSTANWTPLLTDNDSTEQRS